MEARTTWPALIGALVKGESLTSDEAAWAMNEIMEGAATGVQIAGFAIALRIKGETATEVTGLAQSMLDHATPITVPGKLTDLVGTGADGAHTVNISTMATVVAAAAGTRMVKHGNRAASSKCGAADVLEALGWSSTCPPRPAWPWPTRSAWPFSSPRCTTRRCGMRPGRAASWACPPCSTSSARWPTRPGRRPTRSGWPTPRMGEVLAGVLAARGSSALVFHGDDGLDELTTTTTSAVWLAHGSAVTATEFDPAELGITRAQPDQLRGGDATHNATVMRAVLAGETGPVRDIVLLNAAAALAADAGVARPEDLYPVLAQGLARAAEAVDSGAADKLLDRWIAASQRLSS